MKKAIFAGSFDPLHQGHIYLIEEALKEFDFLYIFVAINWKKHNKKSLDKRFLNVKNKLADFKDIEVIKLDKGLVATKAKELKVNYLVRGVRNKQDKTYEDHIKQINRKYNSNLKTIYIQASPELKDLSSSKLREL